MLEKIRAVLFDFGGVFTDSPFHAVRDFGEELGVEPVEITRIVFGSYEHDGDHPWHQRMAGNNAGADQRKPLVERVRSLRQEGYTTGIITNNVKEFGDGWRSLIPVDELFDFVVDSSSVGIRKPDPRIFQLALDQLGDISPGQVIFLDDYQANVDAARDLGLQAILVGADVLADIETLDALLLRYKAQRAASSVQTGL